ncbi:MAG TPA: ergothioneine biosynthesis protein EgtB [Stellaceae bacterium]|nr:ergothioneine biosynthesis protein EgtB [Stellaceae bacterium]
MTLVAGRTAVAEGRDAWRVRFAECRARSEALAAPLLPEDQVVQSMPEVSPTKWHLAHVTWFWETFLLVPYQPGYRVFDPAYNHLFNSYYEAVGPRHPRPARGLLSRPGVAEIARYRAQVNAAMERLIATADTATFAVLAPLIELGIAHEEQHQELILMDIKHVFAQNPLLPAYKSAVPQPARAAPALEWQPFVGGLVEIGDAESGFAFDNERPRHKVWLEPFRLATRLVTNGEYLAFVADGGYRRPEFWLSDGWTAVNAGTWLAPLYWRQDGERWFELTLAGLAPLDPFAPVVHVSHYEADAFARWTGRRLPTEAEWETAAADVPADGNFLDSFALHPRVAAGEGLQQMFGDCWEWTQSAYAPYPGFRAPDGALGEYNGKFMSGQIVLRGGCCATPAGHVRASYRNFFPPAARWCFGGIRLAEDG